MRVIHSDESFSEAHVSLAHVAGEVGSVSEALVRMRKGHEREVYLRNHGAGFSSDGFKMPAVSSSLLLPSSPAPRATSALLLLLEGR